MKITQNNHSDLHATLNILIEPADYQNFVQNALKKIATKQIIPGFRRGKAPFHLVEQKYGDYVRIEEIEKLVNKSINEHLQTNDLELVARIKEVEPIETVTETGHYTFAYELGLAPKLDIQIENEQFNYYKIANEEEDIQRFIRSLQFGQAPQEEASEVTEKTYIFNKVLTQDQQGEWKATLQAKFHISEILPATQALFLGKKVNEKIQINPQNLSANKGDLAIMFQLTKAEIDQLPALVEFEIQAIRNLEIPQINAAFLEKETGVLVEEEKVPAQLRAHVIEKIQQLQQPKLDEVFYDFAIHQLKQDHPVALPEAFLKAQLLSNPELTPEMVEKEFPAFLKQIRTNVLERFLVKKGNLTLKPEDLKAVMKKQLETRLDPNMLAQLESILDQIVDQQYQQLVKAESQEDQNRFAELQETAIQYRIIQYLKHTAQIIEQEISQEQLNNKLQELQKSYQNQK